MSSKTAVVDSKGFKESNEAEEISEKEILMAPRQEELLDKMLTRMEAMHTVQVTMLHKFSNGQGHWTLDLVKYLALMVTLAGAFYWAGSTVRESQVTLMFLREQNMEILKELKLEKENQYDLKSQVGILRSELDNVKKRR